MFKITNEAILTKTIQPYSKNRIAGLKHIILFKIFSKGCLDKCLLYICRAKKLIRPQIPEDLMENWRKLLTILKEWNG